MFNGSSMEHYSAMKRKEILTRAATCVNLENSLRARSQAHKVPCCTIPFIRIT